LGTGGAVESGMRHAAEQPADFIIADKGQWCSGRMLCRFDLLKNRETPGAAGPRIGLRGSQLMAFVIRRAERNSRKPEARAEGMRVWV
jgi:hypothetical protein